MATISEIEGIGPAFAAKLAEAGVRSTGELLKKGRTAKDRKALAAAAGVTPKQILEWVNRADLFRVKGIGAQYSDLLEAAGVDTVVELAGRKPEALLETLAKVNAKKNKVNQMPGLTQVKGWVESAKSLERAVEY